MLIHYHCHSVLETAGLETGNSGQDNADPLPVRSNSIWSVGFLSLPALDGITLMWLLVISLCLIGFILLGKRKKELEQANQDIWAHSPTLVNTLLLATDQNSGLILRRTGDDAGLPQAMSCLFLKFEPKSLIVQLNQQSPPIHELWTGFSIVGSFFVDIGGQQFFFQFDSKILRISQDRDLCLIALTCPKRLLPHNRRRHDRVQPDPEQVLALGVWPITADPLDDLPSPDEKWENLDHSGGGFSNGVSWQFFPSDPSRLSSAPLACCPGRNDELRLADICASGLGLRMKRDRMGLMLENCLILISLQTQGRPLSLWLACRRRHISAVRGVSTCVAGLDIRRWALYSEFGKPLVWKQVDHNNTVGPLRNWVIKFRARERKNFTKFINF